MNKQKVAVDNRQFGRVVRSAGGARGAGRTRRRGQALLMAVLLMVFAALLGATFITVVALNLSQTARSESKNDARLAAQAGLRYANDQLTQSEEGENWRPEQVSPPPAPGDNTYNTYYTPFERAQGWARSVPKETNDRNNDGQVDDEDDWIKLEEEKANGYRVFVKVPDPRQQTFSNFNTPTYLLEVAPVTSGDQKDTLRIDIIGRATDNESAFYRTTTHKGTSLNGGPFAFARFDGNYDTTRGKPLETEIRAVDRSSTPFIDVKDAKGIGRGMTLMLRRGNLSQSLVVSDVKLDQPVAGGTVDRIFLNGAPGTGFAAGDEARVVSTLMGGLNTIDDDGADDATPATLAATEMPEQAATDDRTVIPPDDQSRSMGVHINGGLLLKEKAELALSTVAGREDDVTVAGRIAREGTTTAQLREAGTGTTATMPDSTTIGNAAYNSSRLQQRVRDAAGTQRGNPTERSGSVRSIAQPKIDGAFSRYLQMTKLADYDGALYGYGPGVYINNVEDVEKVGIVPANTTEPRRYRALSISELHRLWQRKSFKADATSSTPVPGKEFANVNDAQYAGGITGTFRHRLAYPRIHTIAGVPNDNYAFPATGSLEQRGIRGWISPHEFLPRGVSIELRGNEAIITRDDRSDDEPAPNPYNNAPDPRKAWKNPNGSDLTNPGEKTYRMVLNLTNGNRSFGAPGFETNTVSGPPEGFNGVIFAEGNVRVRGYLNNLGRDVTIVSMGNIYIEGNIRRLGANARHVALLARKNVTLNPTQFIARVEGAGDRDVAATATTAAQTLSGTSATVSVSSITPFRVGDRVHVGAVSWPIITSISGSPTGAGTLTVAGPFGAGTLVPAGASVRTLADTQVSAQAAAMGNQYLRQLVVQPVVPIPAPPGPYNAQTDLFSNLFVRDVRFDGDGSVQMPGPYYLSLLNAGERQFVEFTYAHTSGSPKVDVKEDVTSPSSGSNGIEADEKLFRADDPSNSGNPGNFLYDLLRYRTQSQGIIPIDTLPRETDQPSRTLNDFENYFNLAHGDGDTNVNSGDKWVMSGTPLTLRTVPPRYLASIGIGRESDPIDDDPILVTNQKLQIPVSVSVGVFWRSGFNNPDLNAAPDYLIGSSRTALGADDFETVQEEFYQTGPLAAKTQARLRWINRLLTNGTAAEQPTSGSNIIALNPNYAGLESAAAILPNYRLGAAKIERDDFASGSPFVPGMDISVEATIFAQDGSWFVIPMPMQPSDVNGDNTVDAGEQLQATRYRRLNYRINVRGNITQNISPTADVDYDNELDSDGTRIINGGSYTAPGAMRTWIDSLSYPDQVSTGGRGINWRTITYQAGPLPRDHRLYLPVTPDLMYSG